MGVAVWKFAYFGGVGMGVHGLTMRYKEMNNQLKLQSNLPLLQPVLQALSSVIVLGLGNQFTEVIYSMWLNPTDKQFQSQEA